MEPKPGIKTSEFWIAAVSNIVGAILALLAGYGLVKGEESELWLTLIQSVAVTVIPMSLAIINATYITSRAKVKIGSKK